MLAIDLMFAFIFGVGIIFILLMAKLASAPERWSSSARIGEEVERKRIGRLWRCLECGSSGRGRKFLSKHREEAEHEKFGLA